MIGIDRNNKGNIYVLDGGFSSQLSRHVGITADGDPLWTSRFLQTHSQEIVETHLDFIRAGSDIISTNTYQASIGAFIKHLGVSSDEGLSLIKHAVHLAQKARSNYIDECKSNNLIPRNVLIAGSVGPFGASLNDGSEYSGNYIKTISETHIREWHKPRLDVLVESGVDLIAFETIPCEKEAIVLVNMLKEYPEKKGWISFSCKNDNSNAYGENISEVVMNCLKANNRQIIAVGFNCCSPKLISNLTTNLKVDIPIVTYPNSGEKFSPDCGWADDQCQPLHTFVSTWLDLNVKYIGGCCRTYCEDIAHIRKEVDTWLKDKQDK